MDDLIEGQYLLPEAKKVARVVLQCLTTAEYRPNMDEVVRSLKQVQDSNDTIVGVDSPPESWIKFNCNGAYKKTVNFLGCGGLL
ncbi:Interface between microtubules and kinetochore protein [Trifolium repens]|nr:Interface between microtubules and kinetochore protein [Trifolium repens]